MHRYNYFLISLGLVFYKNTLKYKLTNFLENNYANINVSIAIIKKNNIITINDDKYPLVSIFKFIVAIKVLKQLEEQGVSLDKKITIEENDIVKNTHSPLFKKYPNFPIKISISELLQYMISKSDNNACDILIKYTGGINELEKFVHNLGFRNIEISVNEKK